MLGHEKLKRIAEVDALRGVAIVLMVIYHLIFDLNYFGLSKISLYSLQMVLFQRLIALLFVGIVGVSLALCEAGNKKGYLTYLWRGFKLTNVAILITAVTWIYPHEAFISFGVIHMIALSSFIAPLFFRLRNWNFLIGLCLIAMGIWLNLQQTDFRFLFWLGVPYPGYEALDYYPMLPWFGVVLIGMAIGWFVYQHGESRLELGGKWFKRLEFLGKHSLLIYLLHQVVLVGLILLYLAIT